MYCIQCGGGRVWRVGGQQFYQFAAGDRRPHDPAGRQHQTATEASCSYQHVPAVGRKLAANPNIDNLATVFELPNVIAWVSPKRETVVVFNITRMGEARCCRQILWAGAKPAGYLGEFARAQVWNP